MSEIEKAKAALEPFALVAEQDIGADEHDSDLYQPMKRYNRAPHLRVGDLRRASETLAALQAPSAPAGVVKPPKYVRCDDCNGSGLALDMAGEPDICRYCNGNTIVPSAPAEMGGWVKALEWHGNEADTPIGRYAIRRTPDGYEVSCENEEIAHLGFDAPRGGKDVREAARDCAQADFELRIRSALLPAPDAEKDEIARLTRELREAEDYISKLEGIEEVNAENEARATELEDQVAALMEGLEKEVAVAETPIGYGGVSSEDSYEKYAPGALERAKRLRALLARIQPALNGHSNDAGRS